MAVRTLSRNGIRVPKYYVLSLQFDGLWFADSHEYWARHCNF